MTIKQFIQISKVMGGPDAAAKVINPKHWPDFCGMPDVCESLATEIDPDEADKNPDVMAEHFRILEIGRWAKARVA